MRPRSELVSVLKGGGANSGVSMHRSSVSTLSSVRILSNPLLQNRSLSLPGPQVQAVYCSSRQRTMGLSQPRPRVGTRTDTGGKGWCTEPVHRKYITRKWTMYPAFTHSVHLKYIQNFPSQFPYNFPSPGNDQYIHSVPGHVTAMFPLDN